MYLIVPNFLKYRSNRNKTKIKSFTEWLGLSIKYNISYLLAHKSFSFIEFCANLPECPVLMFNLSQSSSEVAESTQLQKIEEQEKCKYRAQTPDRSLDSESTGEVILPLIHLPACSVPTLLYIKKKKNYK